MEKIQFQTNVPVEVALKYSDGREVTGHYGDQILYTLTDGRVMYVPPIVKKKIDEAGITRGELFTITKAEKKNGTRRTIEWVIETEGNSQPQGHAQAKPLSNPTAQASGPRTVNASVSTSGPARRAASPADPKGFLATTQGQLLLGAFATAVEITASTERYAAERSIELQFTSGDVRAIALSIFGSGR